MRPILFFKPDLILVGNNLPKSVLSHSQRLSLLASSDRWFTFGDRQRSAQY